MENLNLLLKFTSTGDSKLQVRVASRVTIDGSGELVVQNVGDGIAERIRVAGLSGLHFQSMSVRPPKESAPHAA
jgi:hypothetical protein